MNLKTYLTERKEKVDAALERYLGDDRQSPPNLRKAMAYSLKAGGKRIRPILVMAGAEAVGGKADAVLPVACALEMIHTFSLIHDDLPAMDNDDLRRGIPTNHKVFGEGVAILAGDGMLSEAFYLMCRSDRGPQIIPERLLEVVRDIAEATGPRGMVGGQILDLEGEGKKLDLEGLEKIHRHKTGALIAVSVTSGAKLSGGTADQVVALGRYGRAIGLTFQIADDILAVEGDEKEMGKRVGNDAARAKSTYPALLGLEASKQKAGQVTDEAIQALSSFGPSADPLRELAHYIVSRTH